MAKKDGENFDDDLDLSSFDDMGDFDKNGFDDFSMDEEKDRKSPAFCVIVRFRKLKQLL